LPRGYLSLSSACSHSHLRSSHPLLWSGLSSSGAIFIRGCSLQLSGCCWYTALSSTPSGTHRAFSNRQAI
jgi:hypothetical protein